MRAKRPFPKNSEIPHDGHRKRMRKKLMEESYEYFYPHEMLEMFLFECIPRKNTNEIAHRLIQRFGSFSKVINASKEELMTVEGIGPKSAEFLKLPQQMLVWLARFLREYEPIILKTKQDVKNVLYDRAPNQALPAIYMLTLDVRDALLGFYVYPLDEFPPVFTLGAMAANDMATYLILAERYDCPAHPISEERLSEIRRIVRQFDLFEYYVIEYYLVFTDSIKGLRRRGQLI